MDAKILLGIGCFGLADAALLLASGVYHREIVNVTFFGLVLVVFGGFVLWDQYHKTKHLFWAGVIAVGSIIIGLIVGSQL